MDAQTADAEHGLRAALHALFSKRVQGYSRITALRRLSGGASQETWAVDAESADAGSLGLILRRAPGGTALPRGFGIGLEKEAALIDLAGRSGVPVPGIVVVLAPEDGIGSGFVMNRIPGETLGSRIVRRETYSTARKTMAAQSGAILATIHALPIDACPPLRRNGARERLDDLEDQYRAQQHPRPVFEMAFRWLREHLPAPVPPQLVHGDFRNGNLIVDANGIVAVLDWELAHLGDPAEDIGWLCVPSWRFGAIEQPVGGFGTLDQLLAGYDATGGNAPNPSAIRYWAIFGVLFWGVACVEFALDFRRGDRTVERATIGRRASEAELDLLWLIDRRSVS